MFVFIVHFNEFAAHGRERDIQLHTEAGDPFRVVTKELFLHFKVSIIKEQISHHQHYLFKVHKPLVFWNYEMKSNDCTRGHENLAQLSFTKKHSGPVISIQSNHQNNYNVGGP